MRFYWYAYMIDERLILRFSKHVPSYYNCFLDCIPNKNDPLVNPLRKYATNWRGERPTWVSMSHQPRDHEKPCYHPRRLLILERGDPEMVQIERQEPYHRVKNRKKNNIKPRAEIGHKISQPALSKSKRERSETSRNYKQLYLEYNSWSDKWCRFVRFR